jgi:MoaA/NifB/PqqE/SkfB family radical SAM enzyme
VGLTTNADLLPAHTDWILGGDVDLIALSVAGADDRHAELRGGSRLPDVWSAMDRLASRRRRRRPRIQVSYLLTSDNAEDLPRVVEQAARQGADELFVVHLDCLPSPALEQRAAFDRAGLRPGVGGGLDAAQKVARRCGIAFRPPPRAPQGLLVCAANPLRLAVVAWDGRVGPCVQLLLPTGEAIPRCAEGERHVVEPLSYGNLAHRSLREILGGGSFRRFTRPLTARLEAEGRFRASCVQLGASDAIRELERADSRRDEELARQPLPPGCTGCPKALGW